MEALAFTLIKRQELHYSIVENYLKGLGIWPHQHYQVTQTNAISEIRLRNHILHNFNA